MRTDCTVAILVDGGFFIKRYNKLVGFYPARNIVKHLHKVCLNCYLGTDDYLYRILYYDCAPYSADDVKQAAERSFDISDEESENFVKKFFKEEKAKFRKDVLDALKKTPKMAVRLGKLKIGFSGTKERPEPTRKQKGVDMRMGLDIAALALKEKVQKIILVAGDSDYVPAIKFARREGIEVVLDPMKNGLSEDLQEHIDNLIKNPWKKD